MVKIPSVESLVGGDKAETCSPSEAAFLQPTLTTALLGHSAMTEAELEVVAADLTIDELQKAISKTEAQIVHLENMQSARYQAIEKLRIIYKDMKND